MVEAPIDQSGYYEVPTSYAVDPAPTIATVPSAAISNVAAASSTPAPTPTPTPAAAATGGLVESVKTALAQTQASKDGGSSVGSLFSNPVVIAALVLGAALIFRGK